LKKKKKKEIFKLNILVSNSSPSFSLFRLFTSSYGGR
jgi:hypothetical protein